MITPYTPSEVMALLEKGFDMLKFFPAEAAGGVGALRNQGGPMPDAFFCPTGGVGPANAPAYLALKNVVCVGGSWVAPADPVDQRDWNGIAALAAAALQIASGLQSA